MGLLLHSNTAFCACPVQKISIERLPAYAANAVYGESKDGVKEIKPNACIYLSVLYFNTPVKKCQ